VDLGGAGAGAGLATGGEGAGAGFGALFWVLVAFGGAGAAGEVPVGMGATTVLVDRTLSLVVGGRARHLDESRLMDAPAVEMAKMAGMRVETSENFIVIIKSGLGGGAGQWSSSERKWGRE